MSQTGQYQAEFSSDNSVLTLEAANQCDALVIVQSHAEPGEQFTLRSRANNGTAWGDVTRCSFWEAPYSPTKNCKRIS